jgi:putative ABC transport system permease protein
MFKLALRNVLRQRTRTGLTLAAIGLGVASLILSGGYVEDILIQLREATIHSQLGHLQIYKAGQYASGGQRPFDYLIDDAPTIERALARLPGVVTQARRLSFSGLISNGRGELPMLGEGVQAESENRIGSSLSLLSGRRLSAGDRFGIVVGEGLAKALKLKVGDSVDLVVNTRDSAMNTLQFTVLGTFRSLSKEYDARGVQVALSTAAELVDTPGITAVVVLLDDTARTDRAVATLRAQLPADRYEIKTWRELADFYNGTAALYEREFTVLQVIVLVMVLLSVANSVNMTLHERTPEFGIMRAVGRTGRDVFRLAVLETVLLGAIGAALGVVVGVALAVVISAIGIPMPPPPNSEGGYNASIQIVPLVLAAAFTLGILASIGAALIPARRLARMPLVEALRRGV